MDLRDLLTTPGEEPTLAQRLRARLPRRLRAGLDALSRRHFELRVWIADFDDRRTVQSDLLLEIDRRFRDLDIEIPFPQSDLHLRSIDDSAAASVGSQESKPSKPGSSDDR